VTKYVALLRGIGPTNPNMRNDKLRRLFEKLGFSNVQTVISSGNVLYESPSRNAKKLEETIEKALPQQLGFTSSTIRRSKEQLQKLVNKNPLKKGALSKVQLKCHIPKNKTKTDLKFPYKVENRDYIILGIYESAICSVIDLTSAKTPDLMLWLEKQFGKEITTRTWKPVE
jgi:uncharacterized protein (DUF1697 family)